MDCRALTGLVTGLHHPGENEAEKPSFEERPNPAPEV